jgi:hypothetical protein
MAKIEGPTQSGRWKRWGAQIMYSLVAGVASLGTAMAEPRWEMLPETPELPAAGREGEAPVNGIKIWHAVYGSGEPVLMLHGGLGNSNYWGNQISTLAGSYQVIVMDSRGHGRSTRDVRPYSYDLMATDVVALMDFLKLRKPSSSAGATVRSSDSSWRSTILNASAECSPLRRTASHRAFTSWTTTYCSKPMSTGRVKNMRNCLPHRAATMISMRR